MAEGQPDMTRLMTELIAAIRDLGQNRNNPSSPTHLQPYDESSETFSNFLQRLDVYFGLRKIGDDRNAEKAQVFMNGLSPKIFRVLTSLTAPQQGQNLRGTQDTLQSAPGLGFVIPALFFRTVITVLDDLRRRRHSPFL
jgi:hypothetical protein